MQRVRQLSWLGIVIEFDQAGRDMTVLFFYISCYPWWGRDYYFTAIITESGALLEKKWLAILRSISLVTLL